MSAERPAEVELGRWWLRVSAERFGDGAVRRYPRHTLKVREVPPPPGSYCRRPAYAVVLIFGGPAARPGASNDPRRALATRPGAPAEPRQRRAVLCGCLRAWGLWPWP